MMREAALLLVCGAFIAATPSQAQSTTGTRIGPEPASIGSLDQIAARRVVRAFGACVVQSESVLARRLAVMSANDPAHISLLRQLADYECLANGELRIPLHLMRGAVFEGLVTVYYRNFRPTDLSASPDLDYRAIHSGEVTAFGGQVLSLVTVADCVFRHAPVESRAVLDAIPGSNAEQRNFEVITPHLSSCIDSGQTVSFTRSVLRYALAEVVYRHAVRAAADAPQGTP